MIFHFRLPHYLGSSVRRQMRELYTAVAISNFAIAMVMLFEPIFLYKVLGFTLDEVLLFFAAVYGWYILLIPFGAKVASRFGYKHAMVASIPFQILYWLFLFGSESNIMYVYAAPLLFALQKSLYWPAFHATIARFSKEKQIGREFSLVNVIVNLTFILGPLVGGLISQRFGVGLALVTASTVYACMVFPLLLHKEVFFPKVYAFRDTWNYYKEFPKRFVGYLGFAEELLVLTVWPIFIFIALSQYDKTGILVTVATLIASGVGLTVGRLADEYSKSTILRFAAVFYTCAWLVRLIAQKTLAIFAVDTFSRSSKDGVFISLSTLTYQRAEATHILPYVVFFEQSLAVGKFLAAVIGMVLFAMTGSFLVLFGFAAACTLLYLLIA